VSILMQVTAAEESLVRIQPTSRSIGSVSRRPEPELASCVACRCWRRPTLSNPRPASLRHPCPSEGLRCAGSGRWPRARQRTRGNAKPRCPNGAATPVDCRHDVSVPDGPGGR
jgi:hypothetical protein